MAERLGVIPVKDRVEHIVKIYGRYEKQFQRVLLGVDIAGYEESGAVSKLKKIDTMIKSLNRDVYAWAKVATKDAYTESMKKNEVSLRALGAERNPGYDGRIHTGTQARFKDAIIDDLLVANGTIKQMAVAYLHNLKRAKAGLAELQAFDFIGDDEEYIQDVIDDALENELTFRSAANQIENFLRAQILDGNLIQIKGRRFNLKYYARLVARTRLREAQTQATKNMCDEYENDLVQWSRHADPCHECAQYEGQVFSLHGKNPNYPTLEAEPPLHPNCEHNLNPTSERAIRFRKEYGPFVDLAG